MSETGRMIWSAPWPTKPSVGVLWGYGDRRQMEVAGATRIASGPAVCSN